MKAALIVRFLITYVFRMIYYYYVLAYASNVVLPKIIASTEKFSNVKCVCVLLISIISINNKKKLYSVRDR